MKRILFAFASIALCGHTLNVPARNENLSVLADARLLQKAGISAIETDTVTQVAFAELNPMEQYRLSRLAHEEGHCGGFEALGHNVENPKLALATLRAASMKLMGAPLQIANVQMNPEIQSAVQEVSESSIRETIDFLAKFHDRYYEGSMKNEAIQAFKARIEALPNASKLQVELIKHNKIEQVSLRARLVGSKYPNEIVVIGGHIDSVNWRGFGAGTAPGFDDNASGSADIFETLKILLSRQAPERTIEFFWYAGEEGGLYGSSEIAQSYKQAGKDVVGVLQLDMTSYTGSGANTAAFMTDFTSPNLNKYLVDLNQLYVSGKVVEDQCGYGCSDHASWFRQGYATVMPFESTMHDMNRNIHTSNDIPLDKTSMAHAAMFAKFSVAFAMDLANSRFRP